MEKYQYYRVLGEFSGIKNIRTIIVFLEEPDLDVFNLWTNTG